MTIMTLNFLCLPNYTYVALSNRQKHVMAINTNLEPLILAAVDVLLVLRLAAGDEGGVLAPGGEGHPRVVQHLAAQRRATRAAPRRRLAGQRAVRRAQALAC